MKNRWFLFLSLAFIVCLGLYIKTDASFSIFLRNFGSRIIPRWIRPV